jgi:hypothetical protein
MFHMKNKLNVFLFIFDIPLIPVLKAAAGVAPGLGKGWEEGAPDRWGK